MGRTAVLALALALAACAKRPPVVLGERMPSGCTKDTRSERCIGWLFDRMLMAVAFKPYREPTIQDYVEEIGARLAAANGAKRKWTFRVLDDGDPQAYAGFNATIYISRGALAILRDEAELAAVLAHEMGHSMAGHLREDLTELFRDVGETAVQRWRELRYARDDEIQADELAVVYLARAGYDVHAVERMLRALGGYENDDDEDASDDRHPIWRERVLRVASLAVRYPEGQRHVARYNARVAPLVVGDDPRTVALIGETALFAHAKLALDLPRGTTSFVFRGMAILAIPGEVVATAQLIDRKLATDVASDESHTEVRFAGDTALAITVVKDDAGKYDHVKMAKSLLAATRVARDDELARLHPMRFDPTMPRAYWSR